MPAPTHQAAPRRCPLTATDPGAGASGVWAAFPGQGAGWFFAVRSGAFRQEAMEELTLLLEAGELTSHALDLALEVVDALRHHVIRLGDTPSLQPGREGATQLRIQHDGQDRDEEDQEKDERPHA